VFLKVLSVDWQPQLKIIDASDCVSLKELFCDESNLSILIINDNTLFDVVWCVYNHLTLSKLYEITIKTADPAHNNYYRHQYLPSQRIRLGQFVDFSSEKEFGGIATDFHVLFPNDYYVPLDAYTLEEGMITFHESGYYKIIMQNQAILSKDGHWVIVPINVVDFVAVGEIINVPTTTIAGTPLVLTGNVFPDNATYQHISWSILDTGTTNATIIGRTLYAKNAGTVVVTATVKDGTDLNPDKDYTQNFCIEVEPLSINGPASELSIINVYPNPTTGELSVVSYQFSVSEIVIYDVSGRALLSQVSLMSPETTIDISDLPGGVYFVKIRTEAGEVVRKVVKE
jgi:hypothetical protein